MTQRVLLAAGLFLAVLPATAETSAPPQAPAPSQPQAPAPGPAWLPRSEAEIQVLDKVNARDRSLTVKDGASVQFGSLTIVVRSCVVRPVDQPPDAAAYLVVTDAHPDQPKFRGWMFRSDPSVSMMQHPIYDIRVLGCRA